MSIFSQFPAVCLNAELLLVIPVPLLDLREGHAELLADRDLVCVLPGWVSIEMHLQHLDLDGTFLLLATLASLQVLVMSLLDPEASHGTVHLTLVLVGGLSMAVASPLGCGIVELY